MSEPRINYKFTQFVDGIVGMVSAMQRAANELLPGMPVFMLNTGDETFWLEGKWEKTSGAKYKEIYLKVPRMVINPPTDQTPQTDQDTYQYTNLTFKQDNVVYKAKARRKGIEIPINIDFVCSNFVKQLEYFEMALCMLSQDNVFTYDSSGNTYQASWEINSYGFENGSIAASSESRNYIIKLGISVVLQPMIVRYKTIKKLSDTGLNKTQFQIEQYESDKSDVHKDKIDLPDPDIEIPNP